MEDSDKLTELTESVALLREDVKRADDTLRGMGNTLHFMVSGRSEASHATDRIRSRVIDIDDKLDKQNERFDRIEDALRQILDNEKGVSE